MESEGDRHADDVNSCPMFILAAGDRMIVHAQTGRGSSLDAQPEIH